MIPSAVNRSSSLELFFLKAPFDSFLIIWSEKFESSVCLLRFQSNSSGEFEDVWFRLLSRDSRRPSQQFLQISLLHLNSIHSQASLDRKGRQDQDKSIDDTPREGYPRRHAEITCGVNTSYTAKTIKSALVHSHKKEKKRKAFSTYTPPTTDPAIKASIPPTSPKMIGVTQMSFQFLHWISIAYMAAMRWMPMTSISVHSRMKRKMVEAS